MSPEECGQIIEFLENKTYPEGSSKNEKRIFRRNTKNFKFIDATLYYSKNADELRYVIQDHQKQQVLEHCHDDPTSGHLGIDKT